MIKRIVAALAGMFVMLGLAVTPASADPAAVGEIAIAPGSNVLTATDDVHVTAAPAPGSCELVPTDTGAAMSAHNNLVDTTVAFFADENKCALGQATAIVPAGSVASFERSERWHEFTG